MPIPPHAKRVFKGEIFDVYHWEQEMFDGSVETFEMLKRPDTVQIIAVEGDKILISDEEQPSKPPFISLIGGRVDAGEDMLDAAKRELREESGYTSDDWELIRTVSPYTKMDWTIYWYIARNCKKTHDQHLDAGEKITIKAVSFDEFIEHVLSDSFYGREFQCEVLKMKLNPEKLEVFKNKLFPSQ